VSKANILLLEDDDGLRNVLAATLEDAGHFVFQASTPDQAIKAAKKQSFDLMVTDVRMAGKVDGVGTLAEVKQIRPKIRSIIMTGYADAAVPYRAADLQANDYILKGSKSFGIKGILTSVQQVLEAPEDQQSSWFSQLWSRWRGAPSHANLYPEVEEARRACWQSFYILLRSGHFSVHTGVHYWANLEQLESQPRSPEHAELYAKLLLGAPTPTTPAIPTDRLVQLFNRVVNGEVQAPEFASALTSWNDPDYRRSSFSQFCTYLKLWESPSTELDVTKLSGNRIGDIQLGDCISRNASVALYSATRGTETLRLLVAPKQDDIAFSDVTEGRGVLYRIEPNHSETLKDSVWKVSPNKVWARFKPYLEKLNLEHQRGNFDDCYQESRLMLVDGLGLMEAELSDETRARLLKSREGTGNRTLGRIISADELLHTCASGIQDETARVLLWLGYSMLRQLIYARPSRAMQRIMMGRAQADYADPSLLDYHGGWALWCQRPLKRMLQTYLTQTADSTEPKWTLSLTIQHWEESLKTVGRTSLSEAYHTNPMGYCQAGDWLAPVIWSVEESHRQGRFWGALSPQAFVFTCDGISIDLGSEPRLTFAAPEVKAGKPPTAQSDIYSLALLVSALCIHSDRRASLIRGDLSALPRPVAQQIGRSLHPDPNQRHPSVESFFVACEHIFAHIAD
jgi:ActR/RegA family two-component response regulator